MFITYSKNQFNYFKLKYKLVLIHSSSLLLIKSLYGMCPQTPRKHLEQLS